MELKHCPMCGTEARIESSQAGTAFKVSCTKIHECGLTQYWFDDEQDAIMAWNRRVINKETIHETLNIADELRDKCRNLEELAVSNGLALGKIAVLVGHKYKS